MICANQRRFSSPGQGEERRGKVKNGHVYFQNKYNKFKLYQYLIRTNRFCAQKRVQNPGVSMLLPKKTIYLTGMSIAF
jgi:hypothetical protein